MKCEQLLGQKAHVLCSGCQLPYCGKCTGLTAPVLKYMQDTTSGDIRWTCKPCKTSIPSLEKISDSIKSLEKSNEERMSRLEMKVEKIEQNIPLVVKHETKNIKAQIIEEIKDDVINLVDDRNKELDERRKRENNIVLFNLIEGNSAIGLENQEQDETNLRKIALSLGLESVDISQSYRIGKKGQNTRPVKMVMGVTKQRKYLLNNARFISQKVEPALQKVIISRDLTPIQREARKKMIGRRPTGAQREGPAAMQTNSPPVSPIMHTFANPISVTNSQPNEMNIFSNSHNISPSSSIQTGDPFLVDTISEETIIGGILHSAEQHVGDQTSDYLQSQRRPQIIPNRTENPHPAQSLNLSQSQGWHQPVPHQ